MKKIAIFFDAENMSSDYPVKVLMYYLRMKYGEIVLKKAYADLKTVSPSLKDIMEKESIELIDIEHTKTKGQDVDKCIVEDAKKFALEEHPHAICIVSSDDDYKNLVKELHAREVSIVIGCTTKAPFKKIVELVYDKLLKFEQLKILELIFSKLKDEKTKKEPDGSAFASNIGRGIKSKIKNLGFDDFNGLEDVLDPECFEVIGEKTGEMRIKLTYTEENIDYRERIAKILPKLQESLIEIDKLLDTVKKL